MTKEIEYRVTEKYDELDRLAERKWQRLYADGAHRLGAPAVERYDPVTGNIIEEMWINMSMGGKHRPGNMPAVVRFEPGTGQVISEEYFVNGFEHRDDGGPTNTVWEPASGRILSQEYRVDGDLHREGDLPARIEFHPGTEKIAHAQYYRSGALHRQGGPALVWYDLNGDISRQDFHESAPKKRPKPIMQNPQF